MSNAACMLPWPPPASPPTDAELGRAVRRTLARRAEPDRDPRQEPASFEADLISELDCG